eukprot:6185190-Pleurochrysis_carterae.AAC.1
MPNSAAVISKSASLTRLHRCHKTSHAHAVSAVELLRSLLSSTPVLVSTTSLFSTSARFFSLL